MYGKIIPGLVLEGKPAEYPVVNEREIRGAAGIMFAIALSAFVYVLMTRDITPIFFIVVIFWFDFFLKTVFQPRYSIFGWLARPLVKRQHPEYVGAIQKRFAWGIGLVLASTMIVLVFGFGVRGAVPLAICATCIFFMWLESVFGICVGCQVYTHLIKRGVLPEPDIKPACPGGVCSIPQKNK